MTVENDIVLIYMEDKPLVFARIEEILPDHKPGWYHVKLLFLQLPLQEVTWILRDIYINGEPYTMGGKSMRFEQVKSPGASTDTPVPSLPDKDTKKSNTGSSKGGKVISLADLKRDG